MRRPEQLWDQYHGKLKAELQRGSGWWPLQPHPCRLEPIWEPFNRHVLTMWDCLVNGWEGAWEGSWLKRTFAAEPPVLASGQPILLPEVTCPDWSKLAAIVIEQFPDDETTIPNAEQFLRSLRLNRPVAFELCGMGPQPEWDHTKAQEVIKNRGKISEAICGWTKPYTVTRFVADQRDAQLLRQQLLAYYPNSAVVLEKDVDDLGFYFRNEEDSFGATLALEGPYCFPLRTVSRLEPDPLGVAITAMEQLGKDEWSLLQVLFEPASSPWPESLEPALVDPYKPKESLLDKNDIRLLREKFNSPLFAVSIRLFAKRRSVFRQLLGWAEQFAAPPQQRLVINRSEWDGEEMPDYERDSLGLSAVARCSHRPGMLLNLTELSSLVHLPGRSVVSERLRRVTTRTRPVATTLAEEGSVLLGENIHRGEKRVARLSATLRTRHCYIAGASGTGKSTLLLNMIVQDVVAGQGVGVLDPHGDLVNAVLRRIPKNRTKDVILFDPADEEHPFALNILEAKDDTERERIVVETVMALERFFPASWGQRLERILTFAIHTVLHAIPGATLAEVERILTDEPFRKEVIAKTTDPRFLAFWKTQFCFFPKNAVDPVLNKLSVFLLNRTVRNIICQRHAAIDFDTLLNSGKILLANLSTGLLTEKTAGMFGSFLVTKIVNAAFRRARLPEHQRRPWYLYVDEFQAFMNLSVGFDRILAEARKYKLILAGLANQYVGQLSQPVRQAVFGNVGSFVVFRLGVDDAQVVAKELGVFTADEILNLELGQAIARAGGSSTAFNLRTHPEPPLPSADATAEIVAHIRQHFARPRAEVEKELGGVISDGKRMQQSQNQPDEPVDPSEDDLVS